MNKNASKQSSPLYFQCSIKRANITSKGLYSGRSLDENKTKNACKRKLLSTLDESLNLVRRQTSRTMDDFIVQKCSLFLLLVGIKKLAKVQSSLDLALKAFSLCQNKTLLFRMFSYLDVLEINFEFCKWNYINISFLNVRELPDLPTTETIRRFFIPGWMITLANAPNK